MPNWKTDLVLLLAKAELARRHCVNIRAKQQDAETQLALTLCKLQEHSRRQPHRIILDPLIKEKLRDLLDWTP